MQTIAYGSAFSPDVVKQVTSDSCLLVVRYCGKCDSFVFSIYCDGININFDMNYMVSIFVEMTGRRNYLEYLNELKNKDKNPVE